MGQFLARRISGLAAAGALVVVLGSSGAIDASTQPQAPSTAFGPEDAPLTLTVFSDFACEPCAHFAVVLQGVIEARPDTVRVVFRHLPAADSRGREAHVASLAAAEQGRFAEFHNLAFANQDRLTREDAVSMAAQLGLDVERFARSLTNPAWTDVFARDREEADARGVTQAPAVLLNGDAIPGPLTLTALIERIDAARAASAK